MAGEWARLTGPKGDRATPILYHAPPASVAITLSTSPLIVRYDTNWALPTVYRTWDGMCFMEGLIRRNDSATITPGTLLGNVPVLFRPEARCLLNSVSNSDNLQMFTRLDIEVNGDITFQASPAASVWVAMTGRWYAASPSTW